MAALARGAALAAGREIKATPLILEKISACEQMPRSQLLSAWGQGDLGQAPSPRDCKAL